MLFFTLHRAVPNVGPDTPCGFTSSNEQSMIVVFRAIVPLSIWEWDEKSKIYIRFGHDSFGNWNFDAGPGKEIRCSSMCVFSSCVFVMILDLVL